MNNKNNNRNSGKPGKSSATSSTTSKKGGKRVLAAVPGAESGASGRRISARRARTARAELGLERPLLPVILGGPWDVGARGAHRIMVRAEFVKKLRVSVRYANLRDQ